MTANNKMKSGETTILSKRQEIMNRLNRAAGFLVIVTAGFAPTWGTKAADNNKRLTIVYAVQNMAWPWPAAAANLAKKEGDKLGVEILIQDAEGSSAKQSSELRNAVVQGVDGIILAPVDVNALVPAIDDVIDAKVPIITVDRKVTASKVPLAYFGVDNVAAGEAMANYVISKFPNGAKIFFLTGQLGSSTANERIKGVHQALAAGGAKYKIVSEQSGDFSRARALTVTQNVLSSLPETPDAIIASNDDMAFGVLQAMQEARVPQNKILVVGLDALPEALPLIRDGVLAASVEDPLAQATTAVDAFVASLRNKTPLTGKVLEARTIEQSNVTTAERWDEVK